MFFELFFSKYRQYTIAKYKIYHFVNECKFRPRNILLIEQFFHGTLIRVKLLKSVCADYKKIHIIQKFAYTTSDSGSRGDEHGPLRYFRINIFHLHESYFCQHY